MEEQIKEVLEVGKIMTKAMIEDPEFMKLTAEAAKKYLDAYVDAG